jgi:hypothetical protein
MLIVPLDAAHLFDLNAAILGWLLAAISPNSSIRGTETYKLQYTKYSM